MESKKAHWKRRFDQALRLQVPYFDRPLPSNGVPAAVLMLISVADDEPKILLTKRTEKLEKHKGQIAFPGGHRDDTDQDFFETAIRETEEEVGIGRHQFEVVGPLPDFWIRTGFLVTPVVALTEKSPDEIGLNLSEDEIDEAFWISFGHFQKEGVYSQEPFRVGEFVYPIHVYQVLNYRIWGATGAMIKNLLDRLDQLD